MQIELYLEQSFDKIDTSFDDLAAIPLWYTSLNICMTLPCGTCNDRLILFSALQCTAHRLSGMGLSAL